MKRYRSLRWKLTALIAVGSVLTTIITVAGLVWVDLNRFLEQTNAEVEAIFGVVGDQVGPALALGDRKAAGEILNSLRSDPLIREAALYDSNSGCFAGFRRSGAAGCPDRPPDGLHNASDRIVLARPIREDGDRLGTLALAASVPSVATVVRRYLGSAALILLLSLVVAALVAITLQSRVSQPILAMAEFAERIARSHRFEGRIAQTSSDELGVLAKSFNDMLEEIERRDRELDRHRRSLEDEIAERNRVNGELRIAKEKAEVAARMKSEFLANMSHELRTPMNGVIGMISLVLESCQDSGQKESLQVAHDAAQSLVTILNDILDLSKVEAGKMTLEFVDLDLERFMAEAVQVFDIAVREKGLDFHLSVAPDCPRAVRTDPVRLRQILVNLVGNAVKFTRQGSVNVRVTLSGAQSGAAGEMLRIEVSDTGIGIPSSQLDSIFEAFTQADGSHTRRFGGTGLGLTITRRLVDLMCGRLWVTSEVGQGSSFVVELPLSSAEKSAGARLPECAIPALSGSNGASQRTLSGAPGRLPQRALRVLVAEDNVINQKVISAMLVRQGWNVTLTANGREAVQQFQPDSYDLVFMDIQMPEMDGMEATRLIRQQERVLGSEDKTKRTPIIALTANASPMQRDECLAGGIDAVLTKPVNLQRLLTTVSVVLPSHEAPVPCEPLAGP